MKFELKEYNRNLSESELIADVVAVAKKIGKNTITSEEYSKHGKYSISTFRKRFRSWFTVLIKAGLDVKRASFVITEEELFQNLAAVWIKLGRQPACTDMRAPLSKHGGNTYIRHFGGWTNALKKFIEYENSDFLETEEVLKDDAKPIENGSTNNPQRPEKDTRTISLRQRFSVFLRDGFRCTACGKSPVTHPGTELHCDHILPWSRGGKTHIDNLKTLCSQCNLGKGNMKETD